MTEKNGLKISSVDDVFEPDFVWYVHRAGYKVEPRKRKGLDPLREDRGNLIPSDVGAGARSIYPLSEKELLLEAFISINPDDNTSILDFTNRYGLLVHTGCMPLEDDLSCIQIFENEVFLIQTLLKVWEAAQEHTLDIDYLRSIFAVYDGDTESEEKVFYITFALPCLAYIKRGFLLYNEPGGVEALRRESPPKISPDDYPRFARTLVMQHLNDYLRRHPSVMQIFLDSKGNAITKLKPKNLISAIWLQFLHYVTGNPTDDDSKIVRCEFCGKRGHLNSDWRQGGKSEKYKGLYYHIKCHNRERQREYRKEK